MTVPGDLSLDAAAPEAAAQTVSPSAELTIDGRTLADPDTVDPLTAEHIILGIGERRLGRYRTLEKLGAGGMGVVLAAHDEQLDRKVALKFLTKAGGDSVARERLFREARSLARLSHPNIVAVYEIGVAEDMPYLAMELVEGRTLQRWIDGDEDSPPPGRVDILHMFLAIGRGLSAAHELGIVHRDFKPDNVLVGSDGRPRVVDFGLASIGKAAGAGKAAVDDALVSEQNPSLTATGSVMGTPAYMAPEQWYGQPADARSDQFSFCVALFTALYGRAPFGGETMAALLAAVVDGQPVKIPVAQQVPDALHQAILRGLAREPDARWPSLATLLERIEAALAEVQPGLFTSAPKPIAGFAIPILYLLPLSLLLLEHYQVVAYHVSNWIWLSTVQILLMVSFAFLIRRKLVEFLGDSRMLLGPAFLAMFILGHRVIAAATHSSLEAVFAYDFLAQTALIAAVVYLADRSLWPALGVPLTLLILSLVRPEWGPRLWAAFTMGLPPTVGLSVLRSRHRLRGGGTRTSLNNRPHSSRSRDSRSSGVASGPRSDG